MNQDNQYLVTCDIDGTLLNKQHALNPTTVDYIHKLNTQYPNVKFCLITGRCYCTTQEIYQTLKLNTLAVCCNGAIVTNYNEAVFATKSFGYHKELAYHLLHEPIVRQHIKHFVVVNKFQRYHMESDTEIDHFLQNIYPQLDNEVNFISIFFKHKKFVNQVLNAVKKLSINQKIQFWEYSDHDHFVVELQAQYTDKAMGVQFLSAHYNIPLANTYCFGDNYNDIGMIAQTNANTYAMANGVSQLKIKSRFITEFSNDLDGVVRELQKLFPVV